jgi:glutamate-1-semialdehyde 2,1-aminomutase
VYQAGTLSGNPVATAAGIAALRTLERDRPYEALDAKGADLEKGLLDAAPSAGVQAAVNRVGSMMTLFFAEGPVTGYGSARSSDTGRFARYFKGMLARGVSLPPSQFEALFVSTAHTADDVSRTVSAAGEALKEAAHVAS